MYYFDDISSIPEEFQPLASRMRPRSLAEFFGQRHLCDPNKPLARIAAQKTIHSMIFWGTPGTGKTTLARLLAATAEHPMLELSAVFSGVKDIRAAIAK